MFKKIFFIVLFLFFQVNIVFAQDMSWFNGTNGILTQFRPILERLTAILVTVSFIVFVWGLIKFIFNSGDEKAVAEGKQKMVWGVIALFVIISVFGLVSLLQRWTGANAGRQLPTPHVAIPSAT